MLALSTACKVPQVAAPPLLARGVELSEDGATATGLEHALRGLLAELSSGTISDRWVQPSERERHDFFYRSLARGARNTTPMVLKSCPQGGGTYALTIAFLPEETPIDSIPRIVEIEAVPRSSAYCFRSPFESRSAQLESRTIGSVTFHSSGPFDQERAEQFARFKADFEVATGADAEHLEDDCLHSLDALLKTYGLVHDTSECNLLGRDLDFLADGGRRYITGAGEESYMFGYRRGTLPSSTPRTPTGSRPTTAETPSAATRSRPSRSSSGTSSRAGRRSTSSRSSARAGSPPSRATSRTTSCARSSSDGSADVTA